MTTVLCCQRKEDVDIENATKVGESQAGGKTFRCKPCTCSRTNISRVLERRDSLEDGWKQLGRRTKSEFIIKARALTGQEIEMRLETVL